MHTASLYLITANTHTWTCMHMHVQMHQYSLAVARLLISTHTLHACLIHSNLTCICTHPHTHTHTHTHVRWLIAAGVIKSSFLFPLSRDYPALIASRSFSPCARPRRLFLFSSASFWLLYLIFLILCHHHHHHNSGLPPPPISGRLSSYLTTLSWSSEHRCSYGREVTLSSASLVSLLAAATFPSPRPHLPPPPPRPAKLIYFPPCFFFYPHFLSSLLKTSENRRWSVHASLCSCPQIPCCGCVMRMLPLSSHYISSSQQPCSYFAL